LAFFFFLFSVCIVKYNCENETFGSICKLILSKLRDEFLNLIFCLFDILGCVCIDIILCCRWGSAKRAAQRRPIQWRHRQLKQPERPHPIRYNAGFAPTGRSENLYHGNFGGSPYSCKFNKFIILQKKQNDNKMINCFTLARRMNRHDLETAKWEARESANVFGIPAATLNAIYGYEHSSSSSGQAAAAAAAATGEPILRVRTASFTAPEEELEERRENLAQPLNADPLDSRGRPRQQKSIGRRLRDSFRLNRRNSSRSTSSERIRRHREDVEAQKAAGREYHSTFDLSGDDAVLSPTVTRQQREKEQLFSAARLVVDLPAAPSPASSHSPAVVSLSSSSPSSPLSPHPNSSPAKYSTIARVQAAAAHPETPPPAYSEIEPQRRDQPIFTLSSSSSSSSEDESSSPLLDMEASSYYEEMMKKVEDDSSILGLKETLSSSSSCDSFSSEEDNNNNNGESPKMKKDEEEEDVDDPLLPLLGADPRYQHLAVVTPKKSPKSAPTFGGRHTPLNPSPLTLIINNNAADDTCGGGGGVEPLAEIAEEEEEEEAAAADDDQNADKIDTKSNSVSKF
jgi:hypothetical protein